MKHDPETTNRPRANRIHGFAFVTSLAAAACIPQSHTDPGSPDAAVDAAADAACEGTACDTIEVVAESQAAPGRLVADAKDLYWLNAGTTDALGNQGLGAVMARPLAGGDTRTVADRLTNLNGGGRQLRLGGEFVFWGAGDGIWRAPKAGGNAEQTFAWTGALRFVAQADGLIVLHARDDVARVVTMDLDGSNAQETTLAGYTTFRDIVVHAQTAYVTVAAASDSWAFDLMAVPLDGGDPVRLTMLVTPGEGVENMRFDGTWMFYDQVAAGPGDWIGAFNVATQDTLTVYRDEAHQTELGFELVLDSLIVPTRLDNERGRISITSKSPALPTILATVPLFNDMIVAGDHVYYALRGSSDAADGKIVRLRWQ